MKPQGKEQSRIIVGQSSQVLKTWAIKLNYFFSGVNQLSPQKRLRVKKRSLLRKRVRRRRRRPQQRKKHQRKKKRKTSKQFRPVFSIGLASTLRPTPVCFNKCIRMISLFKVTL